MALHSVAVTRIVPVVLVLAVAAFVAGGSATRRTATAARVTPPPARTHVIEIRGFAFEPAVVRASPGDTIVWLNRDVVPHTATARDRTWDTGNMAAGQRAWRVLGKHDEAEYFCLYHPGMRGSAGLTLASGATLAPPPGAPATTTTQ